MKTPREVAHAIAVGTHDTADDCPTKKCHGWLCDAITATIEARDREAAAGMVRVEDVARWLEAKTHCGRQESWWFAERIRKEFAATTAKEGT